MTSLIAFGGGFLCAVLWMDLMFDVQVLRHRSSGEALPEPVLASIAAYYRRATTDARPMGNLIALVMLVTVATALYQLTYGPQPFWIRALALILCVVPIGLAGMRVVPNAIRLGARADSPAEQSQLARSICRDHLVCLGCIVAFLLLEASAPGV